MIGITMGIMDNEGHDPQGFGNSVTARAMQRVREEWEAPLRAEIKRLRRDCAELYQVIGTMAEHCPDPEADPIIKALDNASDAANGDPRRHDDLLPFVLPCANKR